MKFNRTASFSFFLLLSAALLTACAKDTATSNNATCNGVSASFASNVLPLIQTKCATNSGCHASGASNSGGVLTTYAQISARSSNIKSQVNSGAMPQNGTLSNAEKSIISCWVDAGAMNN